MENSVFISDSELTGYINSSYAELYDILVSKFEDYYSSTASFSITTGNTYALPTDFYKLRGVDFAIDANNWISLTKFNFNEHNRLNDNRSFRRYDKRSIKYRITGDTLYIEPSDNAIGTYLLWYIPVYTPLVGLSATVNGMNGWEEYIVVDAAIKMLLKEESSTTALEREKQALLTRIANAASNRDPDQPERVSTVENRNDWDV